MNKYNLSRIYNHASDIDFESPDKTILRSNRTGTEIYNAWKRGCIIDDYGNLWICTNQLHSILRTDRGNAMYFVGGVSEDDKGELDGLQFIRSYVVIAQLEKSIQNAGKISREDYLRYSQNTHNELRDSNEVRFLRARYYENIQGIRKTLKKRRIKEFNIQYDELTGVILKKDSEFSHIRSSSYFPHLCDNLFNGHVVNKSTHNIITAAHINDENMLYDLCVDNRWNTDWYDEYVEYFGFL